MRKAIKLFGLFFIIAPFLGLFLCLQIQKQITKREVKWKLIDNTSDDELVLLKFSNIEVNTRLNWKHSREFEFDGEMYDIVRTEFKNDSTFYWCWWDHEETLLNKKLDKLFTFALGLNKKNDENKKNTFIFLKKIICTYNSTELTLHNNTKELIIDIYFFKKKTQTISVPSPPPKLNLC